jgi:hypothetical protein
LAEFVEHSRPGASSLPRPGDRLSKAALLARLLAKVGKALSRAATELRSARSFSPYYSTPTVRTN